MASNKPLKILHVVNAWPTINNPVYGIFIKEQLDSLKENKDIINEVFFINAREKGKYEYVRRRKDLALVQNNYDLIHYHHIYSALIGLSCNPNTPTLVSFLSDGVKEITPPLNMFLPSLQYQFVLNRSTARIFKKGIPKELSNDPHSFYLPNGVNTDLFSPISKSLAKEKLGLNPSKRYLLFVSFHDKNRAEKRYSLFRDVLHFLRDEYGHRDLEELVMVNEERNRVPWFFNAASAHLLVSSFEGSPNSVKESLACNTPVVSTDVGNVKQMLSGCEESYVSDSDSPEELAYLTDQALHIQAPSLRPLLNKKALTLGKTADKLAAIYCNICQ